MVENTNIVTILKKLYGVALFPVGNRPFLCKPPVANQHQKNPPFSDAPGYIPATYVHILKILSTLML